MTCRTLRKMTSFFSASSNGCSVACKAYFMSSHWSKEKHIYPLNVLEIVAAVFVITIYCKITANGTLHLRDDNISALSWINKETDPN